MPTEISLASTLDKIKAGGSSGDRIAAGNTPAKAEAIARAQAVRMGEPTSESAELTEEQLAAIDDEAVMQFVDDMIDRVIIGDK
jgi:hypothetical protein